MKTRITSLLILPGLAAALCAFARVDSAAGARQKQAPSARQKKKEAAERKPQDGKPQPAPARWVVFNHRTKEHTQACDACHMVPTPNWPRVRPKDEAFPDVTDYPGHASCIGCHQQQFTKSQPDFCTICHTTVSRRDGPRHPFHNPPEGFVRASRKEKSLRQFATVYPHDKHEDVLARLPRFGGDASGFAFVRASLARRRFQRSAGSCSSCHETYQPQGDSAESFVVKPPPNLPAGAFWLKKGTFKTSPGHAACFNCHYQEGGEKPLSNDCAGCHTPRVFKPLLAVSYIDASVVRPQEMGLTDPKIFLKWVRRKSATYRHEESKHELLACTACHLNITNSGALDERTLEVPVLTCGGAGCHIRPTVPKQILNIEVEKKMADSAFVCTKCHIGYGELQIPQSHLDAASRATPNPPGPRVRP